MIVGTGVGAGGSSKASEAGTGTGTRGMVPRLAPQQQPWTSGGISRSCTTRDGTRNRSTNAPCQTADRVTAHALIAAPGNYDYEMPFGNLLKPTYNVAIAEQCRELVF